MSISQHRITTQILLTGTQLLKQVMIKLHENQILQLITHSKEAILYRDRLYCVFSVQVTLLVILQLEGG